MLAPVEIRFGVGRGELETALAQNAISMDGPVWHRARAALDSAKKSRQLGGRFTGFGERDDTLLDGLASVLQFMRTGLTVKQKKVVDELRRGKTHEAIARELTVSRQAVTKHAGAAGWDAYEQGEKAWRLLLSESDFAEDWV